MDATFGWAGAGQHVDDYFSRQVGCVRFGMDDAFFLGACFGQQQYDGIGGGGGDAGTCQVSSNFGSGAAGGVDSDPLEFLSSGTGDVFDASLLDAALAFSRELGCDGGAVSNGAVFSGYSGTTGGNMSSGESNNYGGRSHDAAEVVSPTSIMSPTTAPPLPFPHASSQQRALVQPKRKVTDEYPSIATTTEQPPPVPFPCPGGAKRRAATASTSISFGRDQGAHQDPSAGYEPDMEAMAQVKEMIYRAAAMRPVNPGPEVVVVAAAADKPRRKNVRISSDPQTVAARLRRERVSERLRVLQKLVPGGSKMDTASMLDEAASYLKFLKSQVRSLETLGTSRSSQHHSYHNSTINPGFLGFARIGNISPTGVAANHGRAEAAGPPLARPARPSRVSRPTPGAWGGGRGGRRRASAGAAAGVRGVDGRRQGRHPRAARAGVPGARDQRARQEGARRDGRRVQVPRRRHRRRRVRRHRGAAVRRAARRHGRAPAAGGSGVGAQEQGGQEDARLRPRRAHHDAARRGQDPSGAPPRASGHGGSSFPAGRGGGNRRQEDGGGRRRGQRRGHLRVPRHGDIPHRCGGLHRRPVPCRLRVLRGSHHRGWRPRRQPPRQHRPRRGRLQCRPQPADARLAGGRPVGLRGGDRDEVSRRRRAKRDPGVRDDRRHVPVLLERGLPAAEAADRGGDLGAVRGAPVRGRRGLRRPRQPAACADRQQRRAARALRGHRRGDGRRGRRPGRHGAAHGERGLLRVLRGRALDLLLLRRDAERGGRRGPRPALAALLCRRRHAPLRCRHARQPRHGIPAAPRGVPRARGLPRRAVIPL